MKDFIVLLVNPSAKYLKGREEVGYLRDTDGNICRTNNHAAIYVLNDRNKNVTD